MGVTNDRGEKQGPYDPICGRQLVEAGGRCTVEYKKRQYFFCSEKCRSAFQHRTEKFRLKELARAGALFSPGRVRWGLA